jgi:hypothetical protein
VALGGYERDKYAIKFLQENRDLELWYAPIAGTQFLGIYKVVVPTPLGPAVLQATRFNATPRASRAGAEGTKAQ